MSQGGFGELQWVSPDHCAQTVPPRPHNLGQGRPSPKGLLHTLSGRPHGDPFPLPTLASCSCIDLPRTAAAGGRSLARRVDDAILSLNALDCPSVSLRSLAPNLPPMMTQLSVIDRVARRVARHGPAPEMDGRAALTQILKSPDLYSGSPSPVRTYDPQRFAVLTSGVVPQPLRDRLPELGVRIMDQQRTVICRSTAELDQLADSGALPPIYP